MLYLPLYLQQIIDRLFHFLGAVSDQDQFFSFLSAKDICFPFSIISVWKVRPIVSASALLTHQGTLYDSLGNEQGRFRLPCSDKFPIILEVLWIMTLGIKCFFQLLNFLSSLQ